MPNVDKFALASDAFRRAQGALAKYGKVGNGSMTPIYSRLRIVMNLGPNLSMLEHANAPEAMGDLRAFGYRKGASAAAGGFGSMTTATQRHTNVTKEGEAPNGGAALIAGFEIRAFGLKEPATVTNADTSSNDSDTTSVPYAASLAVNGEDLDVQRVVLENISDLYLPYVERTGGTREYFGSLEWTRDGFTWVAHVIDPVGWTVGKDETLVFGLERKGKRTMPLKASAPNLFNAIDAQLDTTTADNTLQLVIQDLIVKTIGARVDPSIGG